MQAQNNIGLQKSLYIFLSSILGVLLFLVLHRVLIFLILVFQTADYNTFSFSLSYIEFLAIDYFSLLLTLMLGGWYGIWVGSYWYEKVYEHKSHQGAVSYIADRYWPKPKVTTDLKNRINLVEQTLHSELSQVETIKKIVKKGLEPKRRLVGVRKVLTTKKRQTKTAK